MFFPKEGHLWIIFLILVKSSGETRILIKIFSKFRKLKGDFTKLKRVLAAEVVNSFFHVCLANLEIKLIFADILFHYHLSPDYNQVFNDCMSFFLHIQCKICRNKFFDIALEWRVCGKFFTKKLRRWFLNLRSSDGGSQH